MNTFFKIYNIYYCRTWYKCHCVFSYSIEKRENAFKRAVKPHDGNNKHIWIKCNSWIPPRKDHCYGLSTLNSTSKEG